MQNDTKLICLVGMPGAGKSEVANYLMAKHQFGYVRLGQIVLDKVKESGEPPSEELERKIREEIRRKHGMAAMAILNESKINQLLQEGDAIADGLRSFEEYLYLKKKMGERMVVIAVFAPFLTR
jgi:dephospho-CoA kinase